MDVSDVKGNLHEHTKDTKEHVRVINQNSKDIASMKSALTGAINGHSIRRKDDTH